MGRANGKRGRGWEQKKRKRKGKKRGDKKREGGVVQIR